MMQGVNTIIRIPSNVDLDAHDVDVKLMLQVLEGDDEEKSMRSEMAKMESGFIRRFMEFQHE